METLLIFVAFFVAFEFFESNWQKSHTFHGLIYKNYAMYQRGIFTYLGMNPSFFYTIFLIFGLGFDNFWMLTVLTIKFVDILFRLYIMQKISKNEDLEELFQADMSMNPFLRYFNVIIYPMLFLISNF
ncbi:hypothetical protein [Arcobacter sp. FWKO B]|uniref:hypothetical protein n=1 Tax=Arcobacter sp. FWKO B TaxID=2593672 RepID=UPI0018A367E2|nr:hypothetical protein [Arcobacter sp. FWKO B]QOG12720.1 hypothetical protein FWKOB_08450 [Arcobacter sp. FWKO B]